MLIESKKGLHFLFKIQSSSSRLASQAAGKRFEYIINDSFPVLVVMSLRNVINLALIFIDNGRVHCSMITAEKNSKIKILNQCNIDNHIYLCNFFALARLSLSQVFVEITTLYFTQNFLCFMQLWEIRTQNCQKDVICQK